MYLMVHYCCAGPVFGNRDFFSGLAIFLDTYPNVGGEHGVSLGICCLLCYICIYLIVVCMYLTTLNIVLFYCSCFCIQ